MSNEPREWHMASEADEIAARVRLKTAREAAGKEPEEMAMYVGRSISNYYDLENVNGELFRTVALGELSKLCLALGIEARTLFDRPIITGQYISPEELIAKTKMYLSNCGLSVAEFEDQIGFEIESSFSSPTEVMNWNVDFLRWLCREIDVDWRLALP